MTTFDTEQYSRSLPVQPATMGTPMFDRIINVEPDIRATAYLNVAGTLPYFATHFPRYPVLPGVLLIESAIALARLAANNPGLRLRHAKRLRFRRFVVPGDQIELTVSALGGEGSSVGEGDTVWQAEATVEGTVAAAIAAFTLRS
ncbi:3-hydroxyacyl-ACP dehydratase FabZ family protein [Nocardia sp. NPDC051570]|uniref:3-hydroxyacyl-ACP dehydratase FabZ family protein n=1 Tax=Nocardia sp. NPDC051570 TaxID=3364324 RepID=UPI0037ACE28B